LSKKFALYEYVVIEPKTHIFLPLKRPVQQKAQCQPDAGMKKLTFLGKKA
jgi:hypothetical protein